MAKLTGIALFLSAGFWLVGCATGDPRLQGAWRSNKVPMPVEMVKVTKMETVRVSKRSKRTKKVPKTVMVAKTKSAPRYLDLILRYDRAKLTFEYLGESGTSKRISVPYEVVSSDTGSVTIDIREPGSATKERILITFDGPDRYWVTPANGEGWKEYYQRIEKRG